MSKQIKTQLVFSLKVHTALTLAGFKYIEMMPNPRYPQFNCWVYEATPAFMKLFEELTGGSQNG